MGFFLLQIVFIGVLKIISTNVVIFCWTSAKNSWENSRICMNSLRYSKGFAKSETENYKKQLAEVLIRKHFSLIYLFKRLRGKLVNQYITIKERKSKRYNLTFKSFGFR